MKMRILFAYITAFVLYSGSLYSQMALNPRVQLGFAAGVNLSNFVSNDAALSKQYNWHFRFFAGVAQQTSFGKYFLLRTEINYEGLGTSFPVTLVDEGGDTIGTGRYQYNLHYAQVPVLFKLRFGNNIKGFVEAGPYIGILGAAKEGINESPGNLNFPDLQASNKFIRVDGGLKFGAGMEIPIYNEHTFMFGFRYSQGFADITKEDAREWNGAFNLHVGYLFQL